MKGSISDKIKTFFFPKRCLFCDEVMAWNEDRNLCDKCEPEGGFLSRHLCACCGKPLNRLTDALCFDCGKQPHKFDEGRGMWTYSEGVRESLARYKYLGRRGMAAGFARLLYQFYRESVMNSWEVDLITCVPLHPARQKQRGYNQAREVAILLSRHLGIPAADLLKRSRNTAPQKDLSDSERILNIKNAFEYDGEHSISGRNILIIDDIYTTGSTMDACADILKKQGAAKVYALTMAIGKGF